MNLTSLRQHQLQYTDMHCQEVKKHVLEWLKLGVIQPAHSHYNSPIFAVMKKDGNMRLVQDFCFSGSPALVLLGCPASFQRLMETVVSNISNLIVYIDDLLVHSASHEEHIATLRQVLKCLVHHNIKLNLQKCVFGSEDVSYLGFCLTKEGIKPGTDKLKAVINAPPPSNVHEVRQFLRLCNFWGGNVCNFA
jgi:hypothetical protein